MPINLGASPDRLTVTLTRGADFVTGMDSLDGPWPETAVVRLVFNDTADTIWPATIAGAAADWNVDKAEVDALIGRLTNPKNVQLTYTDGTADLTWAQGSVVVAGG